MTNGTGGGRENRMRDLTGQQRWWEKSNWWEPLAGWGNWARRVMARSGTEPALRQTARLVLTPKHTLHRIEHGGQVLLVAAHPGGVTLLASAPELTAPERAAAEDRAQGAAA